MDRVNAGYKITDYISVAGSNYAIGNNPKAPAPYAVWQCDKDLTNFIMGHYFTDKNAAIADMIQRSTYNLEREDGLPLALDFLTDYAREALDTQIRTERAIENIKAVLEDVLCDYETELTSEDLLKDPEILDKLLQEYDDQDHSQENEALAQSISDVLDENPQYLKPAPSKVPLDQQILSASGKAAEAPEINQMPPKER